VLSHHFAGEKAKGWSTENLLWICSLATTARGRSVARIRFLIASNYFVTANGAEPIRAEEPEHIITR
jgi:hypothetical protein